jgi:hypothetical protein
MLVRRSTPGMLLVRGKGKRVEECFGWLKTIALLRKVRHRGVFKVGWIFTFAAAAYNLVRMRNLAGQAAWAEGTVFAGPKTESSDHQRMQPNTGCSQILPPQSRPRQTPKSHTRFSAAC